MITNELVDILWKHFSAYNPSAERLYKLLRKKEKFVIDHIAFRTVSTTDNGLATLEEFFENVGYSLYKTYNLKEKNLKAKQFYDKNNEKSPHLIVSELDTGLFPAQVQKILYDYSPLKVADFDSEPLNLLLTPMQHKPIFERYKKILSVSEYAAWFYIFGYFPHHFAFLIDGEGYHKPLDKTQNMLKENGFIFQHKKGEIIRDETVQMEQSVILPDIVSLPFQEGEKHVPACQIELVKRYGSEKGVLDMAFIPSAII
jgi:hypothetical protein